MSEEDLKKENERLRIENESLNRRLDEADHANEVILEQSREINREAERINPLLKTVRNLGDTHGAIECLKKQGLQFVREARVLQEARKLLDLWEKDPHVQAMWKKERG